jgi:hypothetical protein
MTFFGWPAFLVIVGLYGAIAFGMYRTCGADWAVASVLGLTLVAILRGSYDDP